MSTVLDDIRAELLERHGLTTRIDLNDIAEVIGTKPVSYDEIDLLIQQLEAAGCNVGGKPSAREMGLLGEVLTSARLLGKSLGRRPTVAEIAGDTKHPEFVVRRALESGQSMMRGGEA